MLMWINKRRKHDQETPLLTVRVSKATELLWEGTARHLSTKNLEGPLDVLPMHANFITLLKDVPIHITTTEDEIKTFTFELAVLSVRDNVVRIYADIAGNTSRINEK
jgi:F0F1-type ATP synthase epsilon subunit